MGAYHIVVEGSRVWAVSMEAAARHILEMTPKERLDIPHVDLVFDYAASELVWKARFLEPEQRRQLEEQPSVGGWFAVQHVIEVLTGRPAMLVESRPPIDLRPRERPEPYVPPKTLDPGPPTKTRDVFAYEVRLVDELGEPIEGVLMLVADSPPLKTDADGRVHYDDGSASVALARFLDHRQLRDAVLPRWEQTRAGAWLTETEDHTYVDCTATLPMVHVRTDRLHTIVVQPRVICARMLDLLFDTNKSFLLPSALDHIREIRKLYDTRPRAKVLIVGHTDTTGEPDVNDPLSLNRAKAVKAYLRDDVDTWLDFYGDHMHPKARWGAHEDLLMLQAVLAESGEEVTDTPVRHFQATRGLEPDNKLGDNTRRAIITEYMAVDGTTLPEGIDPIAHGCGENFPLEKEDGQDPKTAHAHDRRVELFFFDGELGALPSPAAEISKSGSEEYPEWRRRSAETHEFRTRVCFELAVNFGSTVERDDDIRLRLESAGFDRRISLADAIEGEGVAVFHFHDVVAKSTYTLTLERDDHDPVVLFAEESLDRFLKQIGQPHLSLAPIIVGALPAFDEEEEPGGERELLGLQLDEEIYTIDVLADMDGV
jgi:hypothetical protein